MSEKTESPRQPIYQNIDLTGPTKAPHCVSSILKKIEQEVLSASSKHAPINSAHEGYAVILEELDEFKEEVWKKREKRDKLAMRKELIQTAAMCVRTLHDLGLDSELLDMIGREVNFTDAKQLVAKGFVVRPCGPVRGNRPGKLAADLKKLEWRHGVQRLMTPEEITESWVVIDHVPIRSEESLVHEYLFGIPKLGFPVFHPSHPRSDGTPISPQVQSAIEAVGEQMKHSHAEMPKSTAEY